MKTFTFRVEIEAENVEDAKQEFSEIFNYDFESLENWYYVEVEELGGKKK